MVGFCLSSCDSSSRRLDPKSIHSSEASSSQEGSDGYSESQARSGIIDLGCVAHWTGSQDMNRWTAKFLRTVQTVCTSRRSGEVFLRRTVQSILGASSALLLFVLGGSSAEGAPAPKPPVWVSGSGFRFVELEAPAPSAPGFTRLASTLTGISFTNRLSESKALTNHVFLNGSGVALGDVDGDGWCDVYFCGLDAPNVLYRNLGQWRFEDITESAGVACNGVNATSAAFADLDGDGDLDLVVNSMAGGTFCFLNDGHGHFKDVSKDSGLQSIKSRSSMAVADVNGDGLLDLYLCAYRTLPLMDMPQTLFEFKVVDGKKIVESVNHRPVTDPEFAHRFSVSSTGGIEESGEGGELYLNQGMGRFKEVSFVDGSFLNEDGSPLQERPYDWELSAMFRDINGDGAPDLYVCNDFATPDRFWINDGHGRFRMIAAQALRKTSFFSMGVDFADVNRDGWDDFLVLDMLPRKHRDRLSHLYERSGGGVPIGDVFSRVQSPRNTLSLNRGDGTFAEVAHFAGLEASDWAWCPLFLDVDLDGWEDVLITNGNLRDVRHIDWVNTLARMRVEQKLGPQGIFESRKQLPPLNTPNNLFRNRGNTRFEEIGSQWGFDFAGVSQGMAAADLDNDGDLDIVINNLNDGCLIYRNNAEAPRVAVRLVGKAPNTHGIGAQVRLSGGAVPEQHQEWICGGRYLSSDDTIRTFAAGGADHRMTLEVFWRHGGYTQIKDVRANRLYEISEDGSVPPPTDVLHPNQPIPRSPLFVEVPTDVPARHHEEVYEDYTRQPLLPWKLSQLGPGVSWLDLEGSGEASLVMGSGRRGTASIYQPTSAGGLASVPELSRLLTASRDQTTLIVWPKANGDRVLLVGQASYEDGLSSVACVKGLDLKSKTLRDVIPGFTSSIGALALADVDGDGDLDLFVAGRVIPGRYPEAASSKLFLADGYRFIADETSQSLWNGVGLVSDAVFSDLDNDGDPDLILACEWGSLRMFRNDQGHFKEVTHDWGLDSFRGWWNGVSVGDFNEDGRMDLIASNAGENTGYQAYRSKPLRLVYGDMSGAGGVDLIEAGYVDSLSDYAPLRMLEILAKPLPFLRETVATAQAYGDTSLKALLGERKPDTQPLEVSWLANTLFLNTGSSFEARALPTPAQWSAGYGIGVGDLDGDGHEDVFLNQNQFCIPSDRPRLDAGRGLVLLGSGTGEFRALLDGESGIQAYGEGRGAALADFDRDGRLDLAVSQNGTALQVYRNQRAKPGIRVRLVGPSGNPDAIGASLRWGHGDHLGPRRELHSGGGYWSSSSALQIVQPDLGSAWDLQVRWPGNGKITQSSVPKEAREITVNSSGVVTVVH